MTSTGEEMLLEIHEIRYPSTLSLKKEDKWQKWESQDASDQKFCRGKANRQKLVYQALALKNRSKLPKERRKTPLSSESSENLENRMPKTI